MLGEASGLGAKRQLVLMRRTDQVDETRPLGTAREVETLLGHFNIAGDGSSNGRTAGAIILHGPGMVIEVPGGLDRITQVIVTLTDDDFAWPVLMRLCERESLTMIDLESGRVFGPA